jgi:hypothetical protein
VDANGRSTVHEGQMTLDDLAGEDPLIRAIARAMRDGPGMSLPAAVRDVSEMGLDPVKVEAAAARIADLAAELQTAHTPRAVVAGNIESWYVGPRTEDRNWSAFVELLLRQDWGPGDLKSLDEASTKVVANLPNPHSTGEFHCRGLVLGYVQSGKTTNFTAVIAKAADAGYRFFVVLSGIHDALRQQTQDRLNAQLWEPHPELWNRLTNDGDFRPTDNVDALLANQGQRVLAVVKKNGPRLRALKRWLAGARPELLAACPVLIIDDEADQASVNTARPERQPSTINRLIRDIVNGSPRAAYVGYTATPFANVLIDPKDYEDLYPRDFIVDLPRPPFYIGPEAIFGRDPVEFDAEGIEDDGHDFIRSVPLDELTGLRPKGASTRGEFEPEITKSLDDALRYFLLSTAARRVRRKGNRHATALVHTSQHVDVHQRTAEEIRGHLRSLSNRISRGDAALLEDMRELWESETSRVPSADFDLEPVSWVDVMALLPVVAESAEVITDNSRTPKDERLNFDDENPRVIVAVGGNTLSRGLTLEGLAVSYFVRTASAYDTLLQMGRWFGYRKGYADLTRLWLTDEMREWFHHLATVEQEIRFDVERFETEHVTPEQLGVRLRTHPKLAITAAAKMQHAKRADVSYSGRRLQTILFNHRDREWLETNIDAGLRLINATAGAHTWNPRAGITTIGPVDSELILGFLDSYRFHANSRDLNSQLITDYVRGRRQDGELTHFKIAVMGRAAHSDYLGDVNIGLSENVGCINRARLNAVGGATYADIKALMSQSDRVVDLNISPQQLAEVVTNGQVARLRNLPAHGGSGDGTGLLVLYPVSKDSKPVRGTAKTRVPLDAAEHVLGVGLVFPETESRTAVVDYVTANVDSLSSEVENPDDADEASDDAEVEAP